MLRDDGVLWLNYGDCYGGSWGNYGSRDGGQRDVSEKQLDRKAWEDNTERPAASRFPQGSLMMMPRRVALALQADGWVVRQDLVWSKPNPMPESVRGWSIQDDKLKRGSWRHNRAHEFVFQLTKGMGYYGNAEAIREIKSQTFLTEEDARWLALLIDTEGSIGVRRSKGKKSPTHSAYVSVGNASRALLQEAVFMTGLGHVLTREGDRVPLYYWQLTSNQARDVLKWIYPHLIVKQRQARLVIHCQQFNANRGGEPGVWSGGARKVPDDIVAIRESLWKRCKELNNHGNPDISDVPQPDLTTTGRNPRSVLDVPTAPYRAAHYATYPPNLIAPLIRATCPRRCCPVCGQGWAAVTEMTEEYKSRLRRPNMAAASPSKIGQYILECRKELGINQREVSIHFPSRTGGLTGAVSNWELGKNVPSKSDWQKLKKVLNLDDRFDSSIEAYHVRQDGEWGTAPEEMVAPSAAPSLSSSNVLGYRPTCSHEHTQEEAVPGIVFDPFVGSGTTVKVAQDLLRRGIGLDISRPYLEEQAKLRTGGVPAMNLEELPLFAGSTS